MLGWPLAWPVPSRICRPPCHESRPTATNGGERARIWIRGGVGAWFLPAVPNDDPARSLHTSTTRDVKTDQTLRTPLPVAFRASNPHTQRGPCCPCTDGSTTGSGIQGQTGWQRHQAEAGRTSCRY